MAESQKAAIRDIMADETAGRLDFLNVRTLAYSIPGAMDILKELVAEAQETLKASRAPEARVRAALVAGVGLWVMRSYPEAVQALQDVAEHKDGAWFLGLCQTEIKDYDGALKSFKKAAAAGQDSFVCGMSEVEALTRHGKRDEALARIRAFQKTHDNEAELHYQKGRLLEETLEYEAAMEAFERAVELNAQHVGALFRLGYWNDLRGNDDLALDYYLKAAAIKPVHIGVLINLGAMYEDRGDYEKAARIYERIISVCATHPIARMYRKDAVASLGMYYDEARERRESRTAVLLRTPLSEFELSARCRACLDKMTVRTLGDLTRMSEDDILNSKNFGETSLTELRELLQSKGLHFGMGRQSDAAVPAPAVAAGAQAETLAKAVTDLDLSVRALKCMQSLEVTTIGELIQKTEKDLLECPNFGQTSLNAIKRKLGSLGLALKPRET